MQTALPGNEDIQSVPVWSQLQLAQMFDLLDLEHRMAWGNGYQLVGLTLKADNEGWLVVLKAAKNEQYWVHFTGGRTFQDAIEAVLWEVEKDLLRWKPDRYAG